jgi:Ca2+-dependent lipid-binding protein
VTSRILVIQARDLLGSTNDGFSDPYVVLTIAGKKAKTKMDRRTLDPSWNFEHELYEDSVEAVLYLI